MEKVLTARAEIPNREWVELSLQIGLDDTIKDVSSKGFGCHFLLMSLDRLKSVAVGKKITEFQWPGHHHSDLLISEALARANGNFELPYKEEELCHCRKIPTKTVDTAIVLGAHTPEKVRDWTSAGSGCGTCRPSTDSIIKYRLKV